MITERGKVNEAGPVYSQDKNFWPQDREENSSEDWQSPRAQETELGVQRCQASRVHHAQSTASGTW